VLHSSIFYSYVCKANNNVKEGRSYKTKLKAMKQLTMIRKQKTRMLQQRIRQSLSGKTTAVA